MRENEIAEIVFRAGMKVHKTLGSGLLESAYEVCLIHELSQYDLKIERQKSLPVIYHNIRMDAGYRMDLVINDKVIIELKAVEEMNNLHLAQVLTYLRLSDKRLGLLINFNTTLFKNGFRRVINGNLIGSSTQTYTSLQ